MKIKKYAVALMVIIAVALSCLLCSCEPEPTVFVSDDGYFIINGIKMESLFWLCFMHRDKDLYFPILTKKR